jgi:type II secretory pathway pseudopilin PulG
MTHPNARPAPRRGTRFLEALVVLVILGSLGGLMVPQLSSAARASRETSLRDGLRYLRTQVLVYRAEHDGIPAGYPNGDPRLTPTTETLVAQLTLYTDSTGHTSTHRDDRFRFGPYLTEMPVNPVNGSGAVRFVGDQEAFPAGPRGPAGWLYQPSTGALAPNVAGLDAMGNPYFQY